MNRTFGEKLKDVRVQNGWSQEELAKRLGTSKQVISRYENGQRTPKITVAQVWAETLGVPLGYLLDDAFEAQAVEPFVRTIKNPEDILPIKKRRIPLLGEIACGVPIFADENFESYVEAGAEIRCDFALRAKGDSMINARICDGDIVFIRKQPTVDNGEIAAVLIEDEATLKRVYFDKKDKKILLGAENSKYPPLVYVGEELDHITILGKAVAFQSDID